MLTAVVAFVSRKSNNHIFVIKDAHRNSVSIACPETSVRVCFGGTQSIYFSRFRKYFGIVGVFVKQN